MSERIEERLRRAAQTYRKLGNHTAEVMFLEAADTLTELRGALQVASVDYRRLSEENTKLQASNEVIAEDHAALCEHNAKLRELVRELYEIAQPEAPSMFEAEFADRMRELGIEAD